jgi:peptidoglycan biosynthesis protein MviN/MurJ (putative lipid II flippase)
MSGGKHQRSRQTRREFRRRVFHVVIAVILIACALSPFIESAMDMNDSVFATGYDNETTVAILVLLLELVLSLTKLLPSLCRNSQLSTAVVVEKSFVGPGFGSGICIPELSPPVPLRI